MRGASHGTPGIGLRLLNWLIVLGLLFEVHSAAHGQFVTGYDLNEFVDYRVTFTNFPCGQYYTAPTSTNVHVLMANLGTRRLINFHSTGGEEIQFWTEDTEVTIPLNLVCGLNGFHIGIEFWQVATSPGGEDRWIGYGYAQRAAFVDPGTITSQIGGKEFTIRQCEPTSSGTYRDMLWLCDQIDGISLDTPSGEPGSGTAGVPADLPGDLLPSGWAPELPDEFVDPNSGLAHACSGSSQCLSTDTLSLSGLVITSQATVEVIGPLGTAFGVIDPTPIDSQYGRRFSYQAGPIQLPDSPIEPVHLDCIVSESPPVSTTRTLPVEFCVDLNPPPELCITLSVPPYTSIQTTRSLYPITGQVSPPTADLVIQTAGFGFSPTVDGEGVFSADLSLDPGPSSFTVSATQDLNMAEVNLDFLRIDPTIDTSPDAGSTGAFDATEVQITPLLARAGISTRVDFIWTDPNYVNPPPVAFIGDKPMELLMLDVDRVTFGRVLDGTEPEGRAPITIIYEDGQGGFLTTSPIALETDFTAPEIETVSLASAFLSTGTTLSLEITASEPLSMRPEVAIQNSRLEFVSQTGRTYKYQIAIDLQTPASPFAGPATLLKDHDLRDVAVVGTHAYAISTSSPGDLGTGILGIFDVSNSTDPQLVRIIDIYQHPVRLSVGNGLLLVYGSDVSPEAPLENLEVYDLSDPTDPPLVYEGGKPDLIFMGQKVDYYMSIQAIGPEGSSVQIDRLTGSQLEYISADFVLYARMMDVLLRPDPGENDVLYTVTTTTLELVEIQEFGSLQSTFSTVLQGSEAA